MTSKTGTLKKSVVIKRPMEEVFSFQNDPAHASLQPSRFKGHDGSPLYKFVSFYIRIVDTDFHISRALLLE